MNKYQNMLKVSLILILIITVSPLIASGPGSPPATPIDGGLSLLLAAGVAYGTRKVIKKKRQNVD